MKYFNILVLFLVLSSCKNEVKEDSKTDLKNQLTSINGYPDDFRGCGCVFSESKAAFENKQFIYLEKYGMPDESQNFEMMSLNGEIVKWFSSEKPNGFSIEKNYKKSESVDPENEEKEGTIIITFTNGDVLKTDFFGTCGC